jgi:hypothetical protein
VLAMDTVTIKASIWLPECKGDLAVLERQQTLIADGYAVRLALEIFQHVGGSAEGVLGIQAARYGR